MSVSTEVTQTSWRADFQPEKCLIGPGVFDGVSTKVATSVGFDFLYMAGSGSTGSAIGMPDLSVMTATEFAKVCEVIAQNTHLPVIADADTGFGGPVNIRRTIQLYEHAGASLISSLPA